jgi:outer membrane protein assembly factor BamB
LPGIFINYRREDSGGYAQQIYKALCSHFGAKLVFMDIDTIRSGEDFRAIIRQAIGQSDVFLAIIGRTWLRCTDDKGIQRLSYTADLVRREIVQALEAKAHVIPVLVGHAQMPRAIDLPDDLKALSGHNAHEIPDHFFDQSVRQLIQTIRPYVRGKKEVSRRAVLYGVGGTAGVFLAAASVFKRRAPLPEQARSATVTATDLKYGEMEGLIQEAGKQPAVVVRKPGNASSLPREVPGPWKIDRADFSSQVEGPQREPKVSWISHVSVGDAWGPVGFAPDGTLFLHDGESRTVVGIKDGVEQWAWNAGSATGITPGGLIVLEEEMLVLPYGSSFLCFNSRGEGGICHKPLKQPPDLIHLSSDPYGDRDGKCEGGAVTLSRSKAIVPVDGNCSNWGIAHDDRGRFYVSTDRGTLYCLNGDGKVQWTYKAEEALSDAPRFSLGDAVFAAKDHLICVRDGAQRWTLPLEGCRVDMGDKAGTILVRHRSQNTKGYLPLEIVSAVDHNGKLLWSLPTPGTPAMLDPHGRLYLIDTSKGFVICLT